MKIGIDIDDTLARFVESLHQFYNKRYGTNIQKEDVFSYKFWEVWGLPQGDEKPIIRDFFNSPFFRRIKFVSGSQEGILALSRSNYLAAVTARPSFLADETKSWLDQCYPNAFSNVHFTTHKLSGYSPKSKICLEMSYEILVEDRADYANECAEKGIKVFLLDNPWNQGNHLHSNVTRVMNWEDLTKRLT